MPNDESANGILSHVNPSRRTFVKHVLTGAAFAAPVIASFSIESLLVDPAYGQSANSSSATSAHGSTGPCLADLGYVGPALFQAYIEDVSGNTRVNGVLTVRVHTDGHSADVYPLLTRDAEIASASLTINGITVANIVLHDEGEFGNHVIVGQIGAANITGLCDFDSLLQAMASRTVTAAVGGTYSSEPFNAQGLVEPISAGPTIQPQR